MKHGDKTKAKADSKTSAKGSSKAAGEKSSGAKEAAGAGKSKSVKAAGSKKDETSSKADGNGKPNARRAVPPPEAGTFTNPVVGNAFKRAVKKYPNAFRRLTD